MQNWKNIVPLARYLIIPAALIVLTTWLLNTPPGFLGKLDGIGYAVCHRIPERSFHIEGRPMPLCARCSGMYLGAMAALVYQSLFHPRSQKFPRWPVAVFLALFAAAFAVDGANSYLYLIKSVSDGPLAQLPNLYLPNNTLRLLTGSGMGISLAALLYPAFNQTFWNQPEDRRAIEGKDLLILMGITLFIDLLVLTELPIILYPAAVISAGGVVVLLTMVYTLVWLMLMNEENSFVHLKQAWLAFLAGLTIAFLQILAIDLFRFWLTGTWGPIPLG